MLYLPPGVAHDGVAVGECITYSIGFRAPTWQELLDPWLAHFAEHARRARALRATPGQRPVRHPAALPPAMTRQVHAALSRTRPTPRRHGALPAGAAVRAQAAGGVRAARGARRPWPHSRAARRRRGVALDLRSRMLTGRAGVALNGELFAVARSFGPHCNAWPISARLDARALARAPAPLMALLRDWLLAGWLGFGPRS